MDSTNRKFQKANLELAVCWQLFRRHLLVFTMADLAFTLPANAGDVRDTGLIPNPLQYSGLENPMDRGAWNTKVYRLQRAGHD